MEKWKTIKESDGTYEVSNLGTIRHFNKILKPRFNKTNGYHSVCILSKGNTYIYRYIHRLVALSFCQNSNPDFYKEVNHIDGNKINNQATNLEWVNRKLNMVHASTHNLINKHSEKRKNTCRANQLKSIEKHKRKCVEYDENGVIVTIHNTYTEEKGCTSRMYRLSYYGHYYRDYNILINKYGKIPNCIDVERIKTINDKCSKKYTSTKGEEIKTYFTLKELPISRDHLWFCFNNEIEDSKGRRWNIEKHKV